MHQPLISVIITVLNGEKTIENCLNSIAQQTFSSYELVIVDGGSKDSTMQIINASTIKNKNVKVIPGLGLYAGLNAGVKASKGRWLYFMGADDELHCDETLWNISEVLIKNPTMAKVIVGKVKCIKQGYTLRPIFGSPYLMRHQVHHQGMFYQREIFDTLLYDENKKISSDYELNLRLSLLRIPHLSINVIVCNFGGDGVSENQLKQGFTEMQQVHKQLFKGIGRSWVMSYFWLRRRVGTLIRRFNLPKARAGLRKVFG